MPAPNAVGGSPNATGMFDFGGGMNFNPMANGGNMGIGPNAVPNIAPTIPRMHNDSSPHSSGSGSGGYVPSWSPNGGATTGQTFTSSGSGNSGLLPTYQGAFNFNPGTNLTNAFGNLGPYLMSMIQNGGYNPAVFQALVGQLQPQINEGIATIGANTGANGTRFGSGYDLALGDYLSQVNLNETSMAAGLYENSVQNSLAALGIAAPAQAQQQSNKGGFLSSLLSSVLGPLTSLIPGMKSAGGAGSGPNGYGGESLGVPTQNLSSLPTSGGANAYGMIPGVGTPTNVGTPNASDPFGNNFNNAYGMMPS